MKPNEFWECTFKEVNTYIKANTTRYFDDVRMQITIQEAVTSKMIKSNPICNKRPKVINLRDTFKGLFEKNK